MVWHGRVLCGVSQSAIIGLDWAFTAWLNTARYGSAWHQLGWRVSSGVALQGKTSAYTGRVRQGSAKRGVAVRGKSVQCKVLQAGDVQQRMGQ